jgi:hypothetical protein
LLAAISVEMPWQQLAQLATRTVWQLRLFDYHKLRKLKTF